MPLAVADRDDRRARGAWYTPAPLVAHVLDQSLDPVLASRSSADGLRVLDPACGDGRFLVAAAARIARRFGLSERAAARCCYGIELDPATARVAEEALGALATVTLADALDGTRVLGEFDVVVGNPPFLTPLRRRTASARRAGSGGPYADAAAAFLELAVASARPDGGRVGLVLPASLLATRDAGPARRAALAGGRLESLWWAQQSVFDAQVDTCIATFVRGEPQGPVARWHGPAFTALGAATLAAGAPTWGALLADAVGIPPVALDSGGGTVGDLADATADFRDQYYGLVGAVGDDGDGPPLITSGLIDPNCCRWSERPVTFARQRFAAPRVDLGALSPALAAWAARRLVPKVLVATQTRVIEAVVDAEGAWLPSVPVLTVTPRTPEDLWAIAAVLAAPPVSAWAAATYLGAGLSGGAFKLSARQVLGLPLPRHSWADATDALRGGDLHKCAELMCAAYELDDPAVLVWWRTHVDARNPHKP